MLFSSTTDAYGGLGGVATSFFADIKPFVLLILGIALALFIIEIIIGIVSRQKNVSSDINSK